MKGSLQNRAKFCLSYPLALMRISMRVRHRIWSSHSKSQMLMQFPWVVLSCADVTVLYPLYVLPLAGLNSVFKLLFQSCLMQHQSSSPDKEHGSWGGKRKICSRVSMQLFLLHQWKWRACRRPRGRGEIFLGVTLLRWQILQKENPTHFWVLNSFPSVCPAFWTDISRE